MARLIQIHDVTSGREIVSQRSFEDDSAIHPWIISVRLDHPEEIKLEAVTEDSPHFFVQVAPATN